jgi:hypothetical protein
MRGSGGEDRGQRPEASYLADEWRGDTLARLPDEVVARTTVACAAAVYRDLAHPSTTDEARVEAYSQLHAALEEFGSRQLEPGWDPAAEVVIERAGMLCDEMTRSGGASVDSFTHLGGALALLAGRDRLPAPARWEVPDPATLGRWEVPDVGAPPGPALEL